MSNKIKSRLGRGLSSLISVSVEPPAADQPLRVSESGAALSVPEEDGSLPKPTGGVLMVPVGEIAANPHQPRRGFDDVSLAQLADSLRSSGLIQPIIVRRIDDRFQLIAGERRLRAAKLAGLAEIPVLVREVDSMSQAQMALVENIQREDLNPIDRASAYRTLMGQLGLTQAELAGRLGEDRSSIANFLRLLDLAEPVRQQLRRGKLSLGHAKLLAGVADVLEQQRLADLVVQQDLSVRNLERVMQSPEAETKTRKAITPSAHIADLEKTLSGQLGMRVQVKRSGSKGRGRLVIHYGSLDQFDQLLMKLGAQVE